jgi:epoxyqueuosine reductase
MNLQSQLLQTISQFGHSGRIISVRILDKLRQSFEDQYRNGMFDEEFYKEYLSGFVFQPPDSLPNAQSIIIVAVPQPQHRVTFTVDGQAFPTIAPPTYLYANATIAKVRNIVKSCLDPHGYQIGAARLPMKLLAVHSGLADYGRNNVTFVQGMGSFHRLAAVYSDMPCEETQWRELMMMQRCENCRACIRSCPSGAINTDRFLLHAERCLVFLNEKPAEIPFPDWCEPSWHNSLIGCMKCQSICPEDKAFTGWIEDGGVFDAEETSLILAGTPVDRLPLSTREKVETSDLANYLDSIPRNLQALIHKKI